MAWHDGMARTLQSRKNYFTDNIKLGKTPSHGWEAKQVWLCFVGIRERRREGLVLLSASQKHKLSWYKNVENQVSKEEEKEVKPLNQEEEPEEEGRVPAKGIWTCFWNFEVWPMWQGFQIWKWFEDSQGQST